MIASDRGYDNPANRFPRRETWKGITIIRIPSFALGKKSKWRRTLNFASFLTSCALRLLLLPKFDLVVSLTSPPLISWLGSLFVSLKSGKLFFWVMDLNPDEAIAAGWLKEKSLTARILSSVLRHSLKHAEKIIVLDRFMKYRMLEKGVPEQKLVTIAPWSHTDSVRYDAEAGRSFRAAHGLSGKFVVMYSGNHSPCHPLDTLLLAACNLAAHSQIAFCFVGGGSEQDKVRRYVQERDLRNVICLPYQPLDKLAASLSAADLQVVVMGDLFAGIVHPCKIYNILEVGAPFLYIGPTDSHLVDIMTGIEDKRAVCRARHGEVEVVVRYILERAKMPRDSRSPSAVAVTSSFSKEALLPQMLELMEAVPTGEPASKPALSEAGHAAEPSVSLISKSVR